VLRSKSGNADHEDRQGKEGEKKRKEKKRKEKKRKERTIPKI